MQYEDSNLSVESMPTTKYFIQRDFIDFSNLPSEVKAVYWND